MDQTSKMMNTCKMKAVEEVDKSKKGDCGGLKMDWEAYRTCVDLALEALKRLLDETPQKLPDLKKHHQLDLKFLKMFYWSMENLGEAVNSLHLGFIVSSIWSEFLPTMELFQAEATAGGGEITDWELMSSPLASLVEKIEQLKPQVKESCSVFLGREESASDWASYNKDFLASYNKDFRLSTYANVTVDFIGLILENLDGVLNSKKAVDDPVDPPAAAMQQQIGFVQGKLKLFGDFANLALVWSYRPPLKGKNLSKLLLNIRTWATHIACLACLFWIHFEEMDERMASTLATLFEDLMQKTMPYSPEITSLYLDVLKGANHKELPLGNHHLASHAACYVDFLLENLYEVEFVREGLILLLAFVMDPPKVDSEDLGMIRAQTDAIISEVTSLICWIHSDETREGIPFYGAQFLGFSENIDRIMAQVREAYILITSSSQPNFPRTNAMGFLDFLLRNLKKMLEVKPNLISSLEFRLETLWEELASLGPLLQKILRLQDEDEKFKDLCTRIINVVYYAEYFINLSSMVDVSVWYITICLSNVIEDIKHLKIKVENIEDGRIYPNKKITVKIPKSTSSSSEGVFVAFHEDARSIMDHLIGGSENLTIISISGMAGQGKTTLAKRIYNTFKIKCHFQKIMWGYVSKGCETRELLIRILRDASNADDESILELKVHDLADLVRKNLKGIRYLVVLDDIWDVGVWGEVKASFPDDEKGSRIMFTSRNHDLASQAKPGSISHLLRLFSDEESWELMKRKLFPSDGCPRELPEIGKEIATSCKGLPLAVSLIAALLGRKERELDFWKEVAGKLKSHLAGEGCMQVMELSYQYLPDHLKACFLYFGAFARGEHIRATKLKLLWIAEGFIGGDEMRCSQDLAKECLDNLVSQSLVVVTERSSTGWIKTCNVHDLLYDLCLEKAAEENFLHLIGKSVIRGHFCSGKKHLPIKVPLLNRKELATCLVRSFLCSGDVSIQQINFSFFKRFEEVDPVRDSFGYIRRQDWPIHPSALESIKVVSVLDFKDDFDLGCYKGFPEAIPCMVPLRYLAIPVCNCKNIPPSISNLWNLETLIITNFPTVTINLPEAMLKMKSLRHIKVRGGGVRFALSSSTSELDETCNIETIEILNIYNNSESKETLRRLRPKLKKLRCTFAGDVGHAGLSVFKSLHQLESLSIFNVWVTGIDFLPQNLKKLNMAYFGMHWEAMQPIKKLPNLEVLKLVLTSCEGERWDVEDGEFLRLRFLRLRLTNVEDINVSSCSGPFPSLEELVVEDCGKFEIPSSFGDIYTLKTIKLIRSPKAARSAKGFLKQQRETENQDLRVFIQTGYGRSSIYELDADNDDEE